MNKGLVLVLLMAANPDVSCASEKPTDLASRCSNVSVLLDCTDGPCVCSQDESFCGEEAHTGELCCSSDAQSNVLGIGVCENNECYVTGCITSR